MITYNTLENGNLSGNGHGSIPIRHRWCAEALNLVDKGEAEILPYVEPEPNPYVEIATLEATRTERRKREARMGVSGAQQWLDDLDVEIEALRP